MPQFKVTIELTRTEYTTVEETFEADTWEQAVKMAENNEYDIDDHKPNGETEQVVVSVDGKFLEHGKLVDPDPVCVCGVAKSEHGLSGCEVFERRTC